MQTKAEKKITLSNLQLVAEGNFGLIFCASYGFVQVCVKLPKNRFNKKHWATELMLLKQLKHPNIVGFFGFGRTNGEGTDERRMFLVMEFLQGGNLEENMKTMRAHSSVIAGHSVGFRNRLGICIQIADAMQYLHETNDLNLCIVHRDLKPANVGFSLSGQVKLFDFGLSATIEK